MQVQSATTAVDPKRPYGGLVPSQPKGTRAFHDAAAYNQHLAQQQVFAAQAQAASQAQTVYRNPYLQPSQQQPQQQPQQQQAAGASFGEYKALLFVCLFVCLFFSSRVDDIA